MTVPGASLTVDDVLAVARLCEERLAAGVDGVVVVQGTDTIEETAFLLDLVVHSDRPVVVTGAMRGAEAAGADGPANVLASAIVAATPDAAGLGTLVVLNDEIHAARWVHKSHTGLPSAFASPSGRLGVVSEAVAQFDLRMPPRRPPVAPGSEGDMPVALIRMSLGDDGRMLREAHALGYRGVVLEGMGAGHVPACVAPIVGEVAKTMPVVLATRVPAGPLFASTYAFAGSEIDLRKRGVIPAGRLGGLKARLLLSLLLRSGSDSRAIRKAFAVHG
jgi:L-asparaginase